MFRILILSAIFVAMLIKPAEAHGIPQVFSGMAESVGLSFILGIILAAALPGTFWQRVVTFCAAPFFALVSAIPLAAGADAFMRDAAPAGYLVFFLSLAGAAMGSVQMNALMQKKPRRAP